MNPSLQVSEGLYYKWLVVNCDGEIRMFPWQKHHVSEHEFMRVAFILNIHVFFFESHAVFTSGQLSFLLYDKKK